MKNIIYITLIINKINKCCILEEYGNAAFQLHQNKVQKLHVVQTFETVFGL